MPPSIRRQIYWNCTRKFSIDSHGSLPFELHKYIIIYYYSHVIFDSIRSYVMACSLAAPSPIFLPHRSNFCLNYSKYGPFWNGHLRKSLVCVRVCDACVWSDIFRRASSDSLGDLLFWITVASIEDYHQKKFFFWYLCVFDAQKPM